MPDPVTHVHNKIKGMKKCHQINEASQNTRSVLDAYFDPSLYTCRHDIFIPGSEEAFGSQLIKSKTLDTHNLDCYVLDNRQSFDLASTALLPPFCLEGSTPSTTSSLWFPLALVLARTSHLQETLSLRALRSVTL